MLYQMVELEEGVEVQYLGVYALKWQHDEWGPPSVGFVERDVFDLVPTDQHERLLQEQAALQELLAVQDRDLIGAREIIETFEDKEFFDAFAQVVIKHLRAERDELRVIVQKLERRVKEEKVWAQHREDMYVAVRKQLRRAGVIKPHEEITVEDAVERLLRQVPATVISVDDL